MTAFSGTRWADPITTGVLEVTSPATRAVVGRVAETTVEDLDEMVGQARESFESGIWRNTPPAERGALIGRVADLIEERQAEVCQILSDEMGTPASTAAMIQVTPTLGVLRYYAKLAAEFPWTEVRQGDFGASVVTRQPSGRRRHHRLERPALPQPAKLGPALLSGSSVVLKPSSATPLSALWLADLFRGPGCPRPTVRRDRPQLVGDHLVATPRSQDLLHQFDRRRQAHREDRRREPHRCSLELGGKSAAIVLDDADLASVAAPWCSAHVNSGRPACPRTASSRRARATTGGERWSRTSLMPVGDPADEGTVFGPLANHKQQESVEGYIRKGVEEGATVAYGGGKVEGLPAEVADGAFVQPTVFRDVDNSMTIAQEEIFGPVIQVIPYDSVDEAVQIANDSEFGLAGAVYSADPDAALAVAQRVRTGTMGINWYAFDPTAPFGGFKNSGIGRENGPEGLDAYCELQSVLMPLGWEPPQS